MAVQGGQLAEKLYGVESEVIKWRRSIGRLGGVNLGTHSLRKSGSRLRQQDGVTIE
jgi:hypothetical protein